ncbi:uncharacterized protein CCOS01_13368 [Colletotrichum costaricense]|uniref:Uncharacterized protein n=1 Tax=Colletotrichum costaricense TaxID=1209916 RepID=A0AAI9YM06_9PEZI|nr:uncharacterized protein CCOS01_13368 [Colletotrichum costaricense]KAK1515175.1 hypothetical protein CCOS01_13368 [Colletotrichum costaricense]
MGWRQLEMDEIRRGCRYSELEIRSEAGESNAWIVRPSISALSLWPVSGERGFPATDMYLRIAAAPQTDKFMQVHSVAEAPDAPFLTKQQPTSQPTSEDSCRGRFRRALAQGDYITL